MLRDTSLQPGKTKTESFDIKFPFEDVEKEGKKTVRSRQRRWMSPSNCGICPPAATTVMTRPWK